MITHKTPPTPEGIPGHRSRRDRMFKMRLNSKEAELLKSWAYSNELSQADHVRFMVFGRTKFALPNSSKLEAIARQLSTIASNISQCQQNISEAQQSGTLSPSQFETMGRVLDQGRRAFAKPLDELLGELKKLKPADSADNTSGELSAGR